MPILSLRLHQDLSSLRHTAEATEHALRALTIPFLSKKKKKNKTEGSTQPRLENAGRVGLQLWWQSLD